MAGRPASPATGSSGLGTALHVIYVHVYATPNQHISGAWSTTCSKGTGAGGKSGTMSGTTPLRHTLKMAYTHPDSCIAAADAQLSGSGHLVITITAHV